MDLTRCRGIKRQNVLTVVFNNKCGLYQRFKAVIVKISHALQLRLVLFNCEALKFQRYGMFY